jgi:predicted transglutaminase-like cysteine proteinase
MARVFSSLRISSAPLALALAALLPAAAAAQDTGETAYIGDLSPAIGSTSCGFDGPAAAAPIDLSAATSKSSAILGGEASALDAIRLAQETPVESYLPATQAMVAVEAAQGADLAPAVGGVRQQTLACRLATVQPQVGDGNPEHFLASKRLSIGRTAFDRDWRRVSDDRVSTGRLHRLVGETGGASMATLDSVNRWVNQAIAYADDQALFGRRDFWAGASRTLALRRGDCEDIALTKLELLAAAGIPREDMILTIARDLVRNADHAVLIVRQDGRYYMLDNASDDVFDAAESHDYRPVLSFGRSQTWLHGY